jgi:anti-sigma B factor antagonist
MRGASKEIGKVNLNQVQQDEVSIIAIEGSIDALTVEKLVQALNETIADGHVMIVGDLSAVDYMSSAGLRAVLNTLKACRKAGGDFRLASPMDGVGSLLEISGFANIVQIFDEVDAAVGSFEAR